MKRFLGMVTLLTSVGAAPGVAQTLELAGEPFNEVLRPSAEISGAVVAGFQIHAKAAPVHQGVADEAPLLAHVPGDVAGGPACVRVTSANGLYDSENEYRFSGTEEWEGGFLPVRYPTRFSDFFDGLEGSEVTASIALSACDKRPGRLLLAAWKPERDLDATLYVNSLRADTVVLRFVDTKKSVRCAPVETALRSAYDTACPVDLKGMSGQVEVEIHRFVNRSPAPATELTLVIPGR